MYHQSPEVQEERVALEAGVSPEAQEAGVSLTQEARVSLEEQPQEERDSPEGQETIVSHEAQEARVYTGERQCATYCCCSWQVNLIPEYSGPIPPPRPDFESTEYTFGIWLRAKCQKCTLYSERPKAHKSSPENLYYVIFSISKSVVLQPLLH